MYIMMQKTSQAPSKFFVHTKMFENAGRFHKKSAPKWRHFNRKPYRISVDRKKGDFRKRCYGKYLKCRGQVCVLHAQLTVVTFRRMISAYSSLLVCTGQNAAKKIVWRQNFRRVFGKVNCVSVDGASVCIAMQTSIFEL